MEAQARRQDIFPQRIFTYFARFHEKYGLPVYPIAVFSFEAPDVPEPDESGSSSGPGRALVPVSGGATEPIGVEGL